jgi:resuscitation-promoting factor RpfB
MDGNSTERGRHRHRARTDHPSAVGNPQWSDASSDRPEWTERSAQAAQHAQPQSWFEKPAPAGPDDRWRPVSDLTDTAWGLDGAWRDPSAQWNVAGSAPEDGRREPGWDRSGWDRAGWDRDTAWGAEDAARRDAGWDAGWATARPGDTGWNPPTDSAWATAAEPASAVAVLDRPEEPAAPAEPDKKHPVRRPVRIALFALVLFGLVAGSVAWLSMDKSVTLTVDGDARAVKTYASTVGGVLDDEHITVGQHDTLAPGRDTRITDGAEIVLRRGRLVTLTVDGTTRKVWTTALTVQEALEQIGYRQDRMWMSADRSTRLPLDGYQLTLRMAKAVTVVADGKKRTISTTAATVGEALDQAGLSVDADDKVSQLASAPVRAGMTITVTRVTSKTTTTQAVLEFKTVEKADPDADPGSRTVQTKGVTGLQQVTTVQTYVNGKLTSSTVTKRVVLKKPVDEVVVVGPEPEESTPPPAQPAGCEDFPTTGGLNWCGLAQCESGLNPNAYNPAGPYYGLYQFDVGTWQANGGTGTPSGKSIAEQTRVAYNLYQARGRAPWPVCGKNL